MKRRLHRPPSAAELICFRSLAVAYVPLQLTKSLSLHMIWTGYSQPGLYLWLKQPRLDYTRVILWPGPIYTPNYIMALGGMNWPSSSSSGSLSTRQVQMFDVAIPLVVELVLSAFYILPPSSSPASFVLVFLLIFFLSFSLRLQFLTVILLLECVRSTSFVWFLLCV